jgi:uncharacterized protein (DUF2141 family)
MKYQSILGTMLWFHSVCLFSQQVVVHFSDISYPGGELIVCLATEAQFMHGCLQEKSVDFSGGDSIRVVFENVEPGTYAISAFHDINGNSKLDYRDLFHIPAEAFGFSKNPKLFLGPPKFKQCCFEIKKENLKLDINLKQF